jgi:hypothetical protein
MLTGNVRPGIWNTGTLQIKKGVTRLAEISIGADFTWSKGNYQVFLPSEELGELVCI